MRKWHLPMRVSSFMQEFMALLMLLQKLLLKEHWNMTPMPTVTTTGIITARGMRAGIMVKDMNAVTIMAMRTAAVITVKNTSAGIITEIISTAAIRRATRVAAVITGSKLLPNLKTGLFYQRTVQTGH